MRLGIRCFKCDAEKGMPSEDESHVEILEDGFYELSCPFGHKTINILSNEKFELLFDIGTYAILDGYYRETVASFSSSLERFYEFAIKVILKAQSLDDDVFTKVWKQVSKQSERQLGAFIFLWAAYFKEVPLVNPDQEFRNDVIHRGVIPTRAKAISYGEGILKTIRPQMLKLRETLPNQIEHVARESLQQRATKYNLKNQPFAGLNFETILDLSNQAPEHQDMTMEEHLVKLSNKERVFIPYQA